MAWEFAILDGIQSIRTPFLDVFFERITHLGDNGYFWIALGLLFLCIKKTRKWGICVLMALLAGFLVTNVTLKPLIARPRPCWIKDTIDMLVHIPTSYSFPSGHTQASFVAATAIFMNHKKLGIASFVVAALIAFSRMYLYVHWPTDILGGLAIGVVLGVVVSKMVLKFCQKFRFLQDS